MLPSKSLTLQGFLQGMQPNIVALIGSVVFIIVVLLVARWFINKLHEEDSMNDTEATSLRSWANGIAGLLICLTFVGFGVRAASYATNAIPHTDLDKSSVYEQMNSNIQKR